MREYVPRVCILFQIGELHEHDYVKMTSVHGISEYPLSSDKSTGRYTYKSKEYDGKMCVNTRLIVCK